MNAQEFLDRLKTLIEGISMDQSVPRIYREEASALLGEVSW